MVSSLFARSAFLGAYQVDRKRRSACFRPRPDDFSNFQFLSQLGKHSKLETLPAVVRRTPNDDCTVEGTFIIRARSRDRGRYRRDCLHRYRISLYWKHRADRIVPRIQVTELAAKLQSEYAERILLADVRSHGYYDPGADRIRGSIRLEPNNLSEEVKTLSQGQRHLPVLHLTARSD